MRRVVVTGMGMVTPLGRDLEQTWESLQESRSGVGRISLFDADTFPTSIAAEIRDFDLAEHIDNADRWEEHCRNTKLAIAAARKAIDDSGIEDHPNLQRERFGVYLGSGEGQQDYPRFVKLVTDTATNEARSTADVHAAQCRVGSRPDSRVRAGAQGTPSGHLASLFGARGPNSNCLTACAASSQALGEATELIRRGDADVMLSGGTHSMIHPFGVTGFNLLTALSTRNDEPTRASRPFDLKRDGFVLGEGAGMLVLEELEHAKARGARIHGEIVGYGSTADAYRITDSHHEGRGAIACMREALTDAGLNPEDIDYINAHGTSTAVNDSIETLAIKRTFGDVARHDSHVEHQEHDTQGTRSRRPGSSMQATSLACHDSRRGLCRQRLTSTIPTRNATFLITFPTSRAARKSTRH